MIRILGGPPVILLPAHVQAIIDATGRSAFPGTPVVLQAIWFPLQGTSPALLAYRVVTKLQSRYFTNVIVWAPDPPIHGFGEPGDLWVNHQALKIAICRMDYTWADISQDRDQIFARAHPMFPDLGLAFNGTSIQWYRKSARNKVRRDVRNLVTNELQQAGILATFWRKIAEYIYNTPSSEDPDVFCAPPPSIVHQAKQLFESTEDFLRLLPASTTGLSCMTLQAVPANGASDPPAESESGSSTQDSRVDPDLPSSPTSCIPVSPSILADPEQRHHPTATWVGLQGTPVTPLPFVIDEFEGGREAGIRSFFDIDLEWVKWAARNAVDATEPHTGSDSPVVTRVALSSASPDHVERQQVIDLIRRTLADGRCIYIEPCHLQGCYEWYPDVLSQLGGYSQTSVEWHDARRRRDSRRDETTSPGAHPFSGTISQFFATSQQPNECINLLDIPLIHGERPWIIDAISDDVRAMRATAGMGFVSDNSLTNASPQDRGGLVGLSWDHGRFSNWAQATTGCFLTHVHRDANGAATWVSVGSGAKIWTVLTPRTHDGEALIRNLQAASILPSETNPGAFKRDFYFSSLVLRPGALFIQPPGQLHMVYTPMKTIAVGGHFLTYDTLPQSLLTRRLERLTDHVATDASHGAVGRLLSRMALALTSMQNQKLGKWQFTALFELVLLAPVLYPTSPPDTAVGKKRKRKDDFTEDMPSRNRMTEAERERFAALQEIIIANAGEEAETVAHLLAQGLSQGWRVVFIHQNSHMNHLYVLPLYPVLPGVQALLHDALHPLLHGLPTLSSFRLRRPFS
ncbi:hypothetical protein C8Q76DRAFT_793500 [Earliella scabrosa]|nr:hypothetical protein C8Q76DRAFT_793500 [Earliella scabrosa]